MKAEARSGLVLIVLVAASLFLGTTVWVVSGHAGTALICGLLAFLGLISAYSLLAHLLGWPSPKWSDVCALGYLLP